MRKFSLHFAIRMEYELLRCFKNFNNSFGESALSMITERAECYTKDKFQKCFGGLEEVLA